ncbi:MAG: APC family permease [Myxococcales bacterium]|nr:APC family permease [Myxococcales bacterium]
MAEPSEDGLRPVLKLRDATLLVVSSIIGVGIFLTPQRVAAALPHPWVFLGAWALGAALSLAGALANAELGAMFPRAGGDYVYLREAIHPAAGVVVGWLSFFAIYAGTIATLAVGFADGLAVFVTLPKGAAPLVACALVVACTLVNSAGVLAGAWVNNVVTAAKVLAMVVLVVACLASDKVDLHHFGRAAGSAPRLGLGLVGEALPSILFSYLGWNASVYVASELAAPKRDLPRSLFGGLGVSALVYLLVTGSYVAVLGVGGVAGAERVAEATAAAAFGIHATAVAKLIGALVLLSTLGTLNASVLIGPRITYAMARDGLAPRSLGAPSPTTGAPTGSLVLQAAVACALVLILRSFPSVLDYTTFAIVLATIADTLALYVLRRRRPDAPRPYRAWGYPWVPAVYVAANVVIAASMLWQSPRECAVSLLLVPLAAASYFVAARLAESRRGAPR